MTSTKAGVQEQLRLIHWLRAIFFVLLFSTGLTMVNESLDVDLAASLFKFHKSIGVLVMFALTTRILVLLRTLGLGPGCSRKQWPIIVPMVQLRAEQGVEARRQALKALQIFFNLETLRNLEPPST